MSETARQRIEQFIQSKPFALFMKGSPQFPMCGFSARVVELLNQEGLSPDKLAAYDILEDQEVRQEVKEFSNWPTLPQLYVNGKFVGGCDIVMDMAEQGELRRLIEAHS